MNTKMVIVVRKDLKMRKGKMIAQAAHAVENVLLPILLNCASKRAHRYYEQWKRLGSKKIVVSVNSETDLVKIHEEALKNSISAYIVTDAGNTEFNGIQTKTAVAIGPWDDSEIDKITASLKLL